MSTAPQQPTTTRQAHSNAIARVIGAMRERLDTDMSLGEMARVAYMSPYHFDRTFKDVTGARPRQYFRALRLDRAKHLLVQTSSSVTDVCLEVGYTSLGTFIRCFTDLLGTSPRRLRLLARRAEGEPLTNLPGDPDPASEAAVGGTLTAPADFRGLVFVGLFSTAIPQGIPRACAIAANGGQYRIPRAPDGTYYVFALAAPWRTAARDLVLCETALRGGGQQIQIKDGRAGGPADIDLHPPSPLDPPLLVTLPALLARRREVQAIRTYPDRARRAAWQGDV